ncbi:MULTISPECIES: hypothetical protein [unclassified Pseudomonas]|uniref:hypothetical protein n=1 Tax=unclassified Pseudomonas TaxID=196821 RepID=UPI000C87F40E|nr:MULTISPECIES: hypothetical protein [unclassified Pseudomonas]MBJ2321491.1 hypothetical protein [Pseudomonas fluorescens]PMZ69797.1 hypothetical protein C1X25_18630 [Pseudomonas sp. GW247-3R2A]PMY72789.1 hypothetical protein C1X26_13515 [Pseudomonas sp. MPR-R3A]PMY96645.1 hypothetical protein C1X24_18710 [Pseudomonas sp. FW305-124]PNA87031.1 hypothetical protein C1X23_26110 [Pseudomonas sp. FW300-E2]
MTDSRHTPDDALLQHYRQHNTGEPPASLDAFILNAARREAPQPQPSLWQRWMQACQRPRWQMAFATVAGLALMIGVVMRSPVPQPEISTATFSALHHEEAAHPAPQAFSAPAPMARMAVAPRVESAPVQAESAVADQPAAKLSKRALTALPTLEEGLQEIVNLRRAGETKAADEKLLALYQRFPQEDLPARLEALQTR